MTSERVYVDVLRLLKIEFRDFVQRARFESKNGIMPDQDFVKLFSNLPELMMLNEDLLRDFEERIRLWESESTTGKKNCRRDNQEGTLPQVVLCLHQGLL